MQCSFESLRRKEVIDVLTGEKLGYIDDLQLDTDQRTLRGFLIFGQKRLFGLLGREGDIFIPCEGIRLYGKDVLLVEPYYQNPSECTKMQGFNIKNFLHKT